MLVAKDAIAIGTAVTPDMVEVKEVPLDGVVGTPLHDPSQVGGQPALVTMPRGSQVNHETFGVGTSLVNIAAQLKPGETRHRLPAGPHHRAELPCQAGRHVDIIIAEKITVLQPAENHDQAGGQQRFEVVNGLEKARTVKTVLQNLRVLYVSTDASQTAATPAPGATPAPNANANAGQALPDSVVMIVAGPDQDAELIKFAQKDQTERGSVSVTIRARGRHGRRADDRHHHRQAGDGLRGPGARHRPAAAADPKALTANDS